MSRRAVSRWLAALFIAVHLFVILFMNRTPEMIIAADGWLTDNLSPQDAYTFRRAGWMVQQYAYAVGLDNRWIMFGRQSRFNWRFLFSGVHADGTASLLPLPRQGPRSFFERNFLDFREAKFHLNIYSSPELIEAYGRHLCRAHPAAGGAAVQAVRIELEHHMLHEPAAARAARTAVASPRYTRLLQDVPCGT
jgi:hypothetical protein